MPSVQLSRLTDDLWLAAHDSVSNRPLIADWVLGIGLATGLIAELVDAGYLELRHGELFRTRTAMSRDLALRPLLVKMQTEEQSWPPPTPPVPAHAQTQAWQWAPHGWGAPPPPLAPEDNRHRMRGHDLRMWMSYLAYDRRAEKLVIERVARAGLVRQEQHRRLLRPAVVRYVPYDSNVAGTPASLIKAAVQRGEAIPRPGLLLAGLFLATGLHLQALATLTPHERSLLRDELGRGLDAMSRELLRAADAAVGEAAMR
jgi:hypothetical protein